MSRFMIKDLEITNFKSIKHLNLNCRKINLCIGEPNTGKSNILEALGLFSLFKYGSRQIRDSVRMESMTDLFHEENLDEKLTIRADDYVFDIIFENSRFMGRCHKKSQDQIVQFSFDYDDMGSGSSSVIQEPFPLKFYKFSPIKSSNRPEADFLLPPSGENLYTLLRTHKKLRDEATQLFEPFKLKLVFRHPESKIEIMEQHEDIFITYPYSLVSDTLQRIVFYVAAIDSNKDSILVFEEPESHTFPYYTKSLGEKIALDERNQYFIATHNPYLLLAILEKAKKDSVRVFITYLEDYQTKIKCLTDSQISDLMNFDPFFNLKEFIEGNILDSNRM
jgi:AAA15 family ATPase/GTPase